MNVTRRRPVPYADGGPDLRYVLRRFSDGRVVDPRRCPLGIQASPHWQHAGTVVDETTGANTVCACTVQPDQDHQET